jgi:regulator of sigma E protease
MRIISASDILYKLNNSLPKTDETGKYIEYEFVVIRDNKKVTLPNVKLASTPNEQGGVTYVRDFGVFFDENKSFSNVINYSFRSAVSQGRIIWLSLIDLIKGTYGLNDLAGPVGLVTIIGDATSRAENFAEKVSMFISLTAFLTINLGILNLLPVPALDGARLLFFAAEAIRRKPLKAQTEGMIHFIGFAALMLLMLAVTFNDIKRLIFGG